MTLINIYYQMMNGIKLKKLIILWKYVFIYLILNLKIY